jgi:hypothetical protein
MEKPYWCCFGDFLSGQQLYHHFEGPSGLRKDCNRLYTFSKPPGKNVQFLLDEFADTIIAKHFL